MTVTVLKQACYQGTLVFARPLVGKDAPKTPSPLAPLLPSYLIP